MKTKILIVALLVCCAIIKSIAQPPASLANTEEMKKLSAWVGRWKGEGSMQMGPGEPKKSSVEERIEMKLDGMIMVVEGLLPRLSDEW